MGTPNIAVLRQVARRPEPPQVCPYHRRFLPLVPVCAHAYFERFVAQLSLESLDHRVSCHGSTLWQLQHEAPLGIGSQVVYDSCDYLLECSGRTHSCCQVCLPSLSPVARCLHSVDDVLGGALGREVPPQEEV